MRMFQQGVPVYDPQVVAMHILPLAARLSSTARGSCLNPDVRQMKMNMKSKLFFLVVLPLVWLAVALISYQLPADRLYVLAIAPSAWNGAYLSPF